MMNHDMHSSKLENRTVRDAKSDGAKQSHIFSCIYRFKDIEDIIDLSQRLPLPFFNTKLQKYGQHYYLAVRYPQQRINRIQDFTESIILEYGQRTQMTIHRLEEYGTVILTQNAISTMRDYFAH